MAGYSTALVAAAARAGIPYSAYVQGVRAARAAALIARYGPSIRSTISGVRRIQTMYRVLRRRSQMGKRSAFRSALRARKRQRVRFNNYAGPRPPARNKQFTTTGSLTVDTLSSQDITALVSRGTGNNQRQYNYVDLNGLKLCYQVQNEDQKFPLVLHIALIQLKALPINTTEVNMTDEFFTAPDNVGGEETDKSGIDFNSTGITRNTKNCLPINGKKWRVFFHMKKVIGPRSSQDSLSATSPERNCITGPDDYCGNTVIERYRSIKQRIQYEGDAGGAAYKPIYLVKWFEPWRLQDTNHTFPDLSYERIWKVYFRPQ